jgi:hypothetical protein
MGITAAMFPQVVAIMQRRTPRREAVAVLGALGKMVECPHCPLGLSHDIRHRWIRDVPLFAGA